MKNQKIFENNFVSSSPRRHGKTENLRRYEGMSIAEMIILSLIYATIFTIIRVLVF